MSGWTNMNYRHNLLLLLMIQTYLPSLADSSEEDEAPSIELLEFLGEWETSNGEWLDPSLLEDEDVANLLRLTSEEDE